MFDHIGFGVTDYTLSKTFFLKALQPLGVGIVMEGEHGIGIGPKGKLSLWLFQTSQQPAPLHLAFTAQNRQQVQDFYRAALEAGGKDNGARVFVRTITPTTMPLSSLGQMVTTSKQSVINLKPNSSIEEIS
jgi:hypothetical protein